MGQWPGAYVTKTTAAAGTRLSKCTLCKGLGQEVKESPVFIGNCRVNFREAECNYRGWNLVRIFGLIPLTLQKVPGDF